MNPQDESRLMKLPGEVRNRIYAHLVAGKAIHVETIPSQRQSADVDTEHGAIPLYSGLVVPKLRGRLCKSSEEDPSFHDRFLDLVGPAHAERSDTSANPTVPASPPQDLDVAICSSRNCTEDSNVLSLQLLGVCKKIHSEAALMPYTENLFIFDDKNHPLDPLRADFFGLYNYNNHAINRLALRGSIGSHQRRAIRNAAFQHLGPGLLDQIPFMFPQLQRLWLDLTSPPHPFLAPGMYFVPYQRMTTLVGAAILTSPEETKLAIGRNILGMNEPGLCNNDEEQLKRKAFSDLSVKKPGFFKMSLREIGDFLGCPAGCWDQEIINMINNQGRQG